MTSISSQEAHPAQSNRSTGQTPVEIKIGQLIMSGVEGPILTDDARHIIGDLHIGNFILMGRNIVSPAQILELSRGLQRLAVEENGLPALIGTDQEGGYVTRLTGAGGFTFMPDAQTVGSSRNPEAIRAYGRAIGEELKTIGINLNFAPELDVNSNPDNPVIGMLRRAFGNTPEVVIETAIPFMQGLQEAGVMATGKHFPGHGGTSVDSHLALPHIPDERASLDAIELPPFRAAIEAGIDLIMPAHVNYAALDPTGLPASISEPILTGLLREELDYQGVIVTDDLSMKGILSRFSLGEAAVRAIEAGADMVLCVRTSPALAFAPQDIEEIHAALIDAHRSGRLTEERIDQSFERIMALKTKYAVGPADGTGLDTIRGADHIRAVAAVLDSAVQRQDAAQ